MITQRDSQPPTFLTPAELANRWQVTTMTLRRWRKSGKLNAHHLGRSIRFSLADIEKIEAESRA
ncbi:MAG: helix-turn-helix domain-containing protein [Prosthecobacter sp.]